MKFGMNLSYQHTLAYIKGVLSWDKANGECFKMIKENPVAFLYCKSAVETKNRD